MTHDLHVVFGTGPAGRAVAEELLRLGAAVRMVNRTGTPPFAGVETVGGDASDPELAKAAALDADTVYFCLNAPYRNWPEEFPPLQHAVLHAAASSAARLVALENLYMYGPNGGHPLTESTPARSTTKKGRTRAAMSDELLAAHQRGDVEVVIGRASDFIGPGVRNSAMGEFIFERARNGARAQMMGRPGLRHTYSYVPDVGRNLVLLGSRDDAFGRVWHLPNPETLTTRQVVAKVYAALGLPLQLIALNRLTLRALGIVNSNVRELLETYYQFNEPFVVDDTAFKKVFGGHVTGWDEIIGATLDSYMAAAKTAP